MVKIMTKLDSKEFLMELRRKGFKITPQRLTLLSIIDKVGSTHPSLNRLYELARKEIPTLSFSTLYNTIKKFEEIGIIQLFDFSGETHIEINKTPHINLIYPKKGEIKDYGDDLLKTLVNNVEKKIEVKIKYAVANFIVEENQ